MFFVLIIVESCRWGCSVLGVFLKVSTDSRRGRLRCGFFLNKVLRRSSGAGVFFFRGFAGFLGALVLENTNDCFCIVLRPLLSLTCRTKGMQDLFFLTWYILLLLFASDDIKYFGLKSKQTQMFFFLLQKIISSSNQISLKVNTN